MNESKISFNGASEFHYSFSADLAKKISDEKIISKLFLAIWEILSGEKVINAEQNAQVEYGDYEVKLRESFGNYLESEAIGIESGYGIHGGNAHWKFNMLPHAVSAKAVTKLDIRTGGYIRLTVHAAEEKLLSIKKIMENMLP